MKEKRVDMHTNKILVPLTINYIRFEIQLNELNSVFQSDFTLWKWRSFSNLKVEPSAFSLSEKYLIIQYTWEKADFKMFY